MPFKALRRVDALDPKSAPHPAFADSVNIPAAELPERVYELPPKGSPLRVVSGEGADEALRWLQAENRPASLIDGLAEGDAEGRRLWSPNAFLEEIAPRLAPGRALDLACGVGRDAVYLTSLGWTAVGVDRLSDALQRASALESRYLGRQEIDWRQCDLESGLPDLEADLGLATMLYYFDAEVLLKATRLLAPGGHLVLESFTAEHFARFGRPKDPRRIVDERALARALDGFAVERESRGPHGDRHTHRLWARKL